MSQVQAPWLRCSVLYQIYPKSFADSDGDCVGDLNGVIDRLLAEAHCRGLRVLLNWAPDHSSDRHPWFVLASAEPD